METTMVQLRLMEHQVVQGHTSIASTELLGKLQILLQVWWQVRIKYRCAMRQIQPVRKT